MTVPDRNADGVMGTRALSLDQQLARAARVFPRKVAFRIGSAERTWAELDERVTSLASALARQGAKPASRIAIFMTNTIEFVEVLLASARVGAVAVPINARLTGPEAAYILNDSGAAFVFCDRAGANAMSASWGSLDPGVQMVLAGGAGSPDGVSGYESVLRSGAGRPPTSSTDLHPVRPALIMYTSGTTGHPKGAVLTEWALFMSTVNVLVAMGTSGREEEWLSGVPLSHMAGTAQIFRNLFLMGSSTILPSGDFDAGRAVDLLERYHVTGCFFVPTQWEAICAIPGIRNRQLALRRLNFGAASASSNMLDALAETFPGVPSFTSFGQTETSGTTCMLTGADARRKARSLGRPIGTIEARLVDENMSDVSPGTVGEIVYRGPTLMEEYWRNPEATTEAFAGGWFHSGDLCREDEDGFLFLVDRKKDVIVSGGENIYSAELEAVIMRHPKVHDVAVVGIAHTRWGETPCAVVVPKSSAGAPSETEIIEWCRGQLASYKKPTVVEIVDILPRNSTGKVLKRELRRRLSQP